MFSKTLLQSHDAANELIWTLDGDEETRLACEQLSAHSYWSTCVKIFTSFGSEIVPVSASIVCCSFIFVIAAKLEVRGRHAGIWAAVPEQIAFGTFWRGSVSRAEADAVAVELQEMMGVCH